MEVRRVRSKPRRGVEVSKPKDLTQVLNPRTGEVQHFDQATGRLVRSASTKKMAFEPFTQERAELVCQAISRGLSVGKALARVGVSRASYNRWRAESEDFGAAIELARKFRSEGIHESFFQDEIRQLKQKVILEENDPAEVVLLTKKLKALQAKQKVLTDFTALDAPSRFGKTKVVRTEGRSELSVNIKADLSEELVQAVTKGFTPKVDYDGELVIEGIGPLEEDKKP